MHPAVTQRLSKIRLKLKLKRHTRQHASLEDKGALFVIYKKKTFQAKKFMSQDAVQR